MLDQQPVDLLLRHLRPAALLADVDELRVRARVLERLRRDQAVVEDDVGRGDQLDRADGQQPRVAGPGADQVDGHATRLPPSPRRASSSPGARRRASAARAPRRRLPGSSSATHAEPSGSPTKPRIVPSSRVDSHGRVTSGAQYAHGGPLGLERAEGVCVMHRLHRRPHPLVVRPRLDGERALAGGGHEVERRRVARRARAARARPRRARSRRPRRRRACAAACRRCRAARRPRGPAARTSSCARRRSELVPTRAPSAGRERGRAVRAACAAPARRARSPAAASRRSRSRRPARPGRPWPSAPRGRSRPPPAPPRSRRPSATCRRPRAPGRRR